MPRDRRSPRLALVVSLLHRWDNASSDQEGEPPLGESHVATNRSGHIRRPTLLSSGSGSHAVVSGTDYRRSSFLQIFRPHTASPECGIDVNGHCVKAGV